MRQVYALGKIVMLADLLRQIIARVYQIREDRERRERAEAIESIAQSIQGTLVENSDGGLSFVPGDGPDIMVTGCGPTLH